MCRPSRDPAASECQPDPRNMHAASRSQKGDTRQPTCSSHAPMKLTMQASRQLRSTLISAPNLWMPGALLLTPGWRTLTATSLTSSSCALYTCAASAISVFPVPKIRTPLVRVCRVSRLPYTPKGVIVYVYEDQGYACSEHAHACCVLAFLAVFNHLLMSYLANGHDAG